MPRKVRRRLGQEAKHVPTLVELLEHVRRPGASKTTILGAQATNGRYSVRRRSLFAEPQPFWGYWEKGNDVLGVEFPCQPKLILGLV